MAMQKFEPFQIPTERALANSVVIGLTNQEGRSSDSDIESGGSAHLRIDLLVVILLLSAFAIVSLHAANILAPAFELAHKQRANALDPQPQSGTTKSGGVERSFHADYFRSEVNLWQPSILRWATQTGLPPDLIAIVMQIESCGDPSARSSAGAIGLFQVMPFHFGSQEDPYDPEINASRGLEYLAKGYERSDGRIDLTLAGYNGGHSMIEADPQLWPEETTRYVAWGTGLWKDIQSQSHPSPTLDGWLNAGGRRLCKSAALAALDKPTSD
jgi:hypothetical protein